jgi:hypothetical protein
VIAPWWERYAWLYELELDKLRGAGFKVEEESPPGAGHGPVRLRISDGPVPELGDLRVTFPDLYPWYRVEVQTLEGDWLGRHHHPFGRTLCLIGRATENWQHDTVATFLTERLPQVVSAAAEPQSPATADTEEHAGEPFSDYYDYQPHAVVMVDSACSTGSATGGTIDLLVEQVVNHNGIRGILISVHDRSGTTLGTADPRLANRAGIHIAGRWQRLDDPPVAAIAKDVVELAVAQEPTLAVPQWQAVGNLKVDVVAIVFPEETQWRTTTDGWVFICRTKGAFGGP